MAYKRKAKVYHLVWEEGDLAGLEVKARSLPMGRFLDVQESFSAVQDGEPSPEAMRALIDKMGFLSDALVSWNIEDEDDDGNTRAVPCNLDGLLSLERHEMTAILGAWAEAGAQASAPLGEPSPNGGQADSRSTEEFLASLGNSPEPN